MANASGGAIKLFVLGDARIETPVGEIEPSAEVVFATALYLILENRAPAPRRSLEDLLWPLVPRPAASHRLRQTLLKLRKLGLPINAGGSQRLQIEAVPSIDANGVRNIAELNEIVMTRSISPLFGYDPTFSPDFVEWLDTKRAQLGAGIIRELLNGLAHHRSRGDWPRTEIYATRILQLEPYNEEGTLALAESHAMRGSKFSGIRILDKYLNELGRSSNEIRVQASLMKKRITDRVPNPDPHESSGPPFVGRGDSMAALCALLANVRSGTGSTCHISGPAGIGKSRLLAEFSRFAALQGIATVRVACRPRDPYRPLSVFVDLVPLLRGMRGAIGCSPETLRYLDRITHHSAETSATSGPGEADFIYARIQQALFDLIDAVSEERPLLILVEDIHRLDEISASLFADVVPWSSTHPIILAFSSREHSDEWLGPPHETLLEFRLGPLDDHSASEIVSATVKQYGGNLNACDEAWCLNAAEGNPYFLAELATHLVESGGQHAAPPSLSAVINQRLSRLEAPTLQILQACALLDNNCSMERIEKVLGYPHHQVLHCINELGASGMLVMQRGEVGDESFSRLAPRHELLATAAENALSPPAQAYLHRRIGTVLEEEIGDSGSTSVLWDCAKHWQRAGNSQRALTLARSCASHLMKLGLCGAAAEAYEKSISFCGSDQERLEMLEGQASAYFGASDWRRLSETAATLQSLKAYLKPSEDGHSDTELMALRALWQRGHLETVTARSLECLQRKTADASHRVRAGVMAMMLLDLACDQDAMAQTFAILRPLLQCPEIDPALRSEAFMVFEAACGDLTAAVAHAENLIVARRQSDKISDLTRALSNGSVAARTAGRIDLAKDWLLEALAIFESHKLPLASEVPMQILASIALDENDIVGAKAWHARLTNVPNSTADSIAVRNTIGVRIALSDHDVREARLLTDGRLEDLRDDTNPHRRIYGLALLMAVELAEGKHPNQELLNLLEQSHLIARANARQSFATFVLVSALRKAGKHLRAEDLLREYCERFRREPTPPPFHILHLMESFAETR